MSPHVQKRRWLSSCSRRKAAIPVHRPMPCSGSWRSDRTWSRSRSTSDPFSSPEATKRQRDYAQSLGLSSVYTPEMVIDGSFDIVGSNRARVDQVIATASQRQKLPVAIVAGSAGGWHVTIPAGEAAEPATVWLALYDRRHSTPVRRGENAGKTLTDYNIVREFRAIGQWTGAKLDLPVDIGATDLAERGFAVIIQTATASRILGAALAPVPTTGGS